MWPLPHPRGAVAFSAAHGAAGTTVHLHSLVTTLTETGARSAGAPVSSPWEPLSTLCLQGCDCSRQRKTTPVSPLLSASPLLTLLARVGGKGPHARPDKLGRPAWRPCRLSPQDHTAWLGRKTSQRKASHGGPSRPGPGSSLTKVGLYLR